MTRVTSPFKTISVNCTFFNITLEYKKKLISFLIFTNHFDFYFTGVDAGGEDIMVP